MDTMEEPAMEMTEQDREAYDLLMGIAQLINWLPDPDSFTTWNGYVDNEHCFRISKIQSLNKIYYELAKLVRDSGQWLWMDAVDTLEEAKAEAKGIVERHKQNGTWVGM